jgi:membrane protein
MREISPESPEARRKRLARARAHFGTVREQIRTGSPWQVIKRVAIGVYSDGFIHAGNLAYLALLSIFPFVIVAAAVARVFGQTAAGMDAVNALLQTMPPNVADVLRVPIHDVVEARSGSLLWLGALVGLWTSGSFIDTIRIIRRAYGVTYSRPFWEYRLGSVGMIIAAVVIAMVAFSASILLSGVQQFLVARIPGADDLVSLLTLLRAAPALMLFGSLYLLFFVLTPKRYRLTCRKWPGAAFVALWWVATTALLPVVLSGLVSYDLTYGSLAGVIIALFFFFIIGLGLVIGAELNAALAETPTPTQEDLIAVVQEEVAEEAVHKAEESAEHAEERAAARAQQEDE